MTRALRLLPLLLALGCRSSPSPGDALSNQPAPGSVAQAAEMKDAGAAWTNGDIRAFYLRTIATIGPSNEQWKQQQVPADERARRAFAVRHDARLTARAMMKDPAEVTLLQERDRAKYGTPDGPTFDFLVAQNQKNGLAGDAVYEAIVASAQRTDGAVNDMFGH